MEKKPPRWEARLMQRVYIFCEGQTEETFVRDVLQSHFNNFNVSLYSIVFNTSSNSKGGISSYQKIKHQISKKCLEDKSAWVTTLIDFYGSPTDFPGKDTMLSLTDPYKKIQYLEDNFANDIKQRNFIPNLILHEYEALLFSDISKFEPWYEKKIIETLKNNITAFDNPEFINDSPQTAPSKRILKCCPSYNKPIHGSLIASAIGLDQIRYKCQHFGTWLETIEKLG
jgi:hypothetical protein